MLETAEQEFGQAGVDKLLAELGTNRAELQDPNAWFSLEFAEAFLEALATRAPDPGALDRAGRLAFSPRYLGIVYPLIRSFGSPGFTFRQAAALIPRLNKVITCQAEDLDAQRTRIICRTREGAPREQKPYFCRVRTVQLEQIATLFDLPPAEVTHVECMHRGGEACVYDVAWKEHRRPFWSWVGLFGGATAALWFAHVVDVHALAQVAVTIAASAGGWAIGRTLELRRDLSSRLGDLSNVYDALGRSTQAHEIRFAELLEAKTEVEKKVEQRTSELREASQQLSEALGKLQELDRAKTDFFNNVSHELRSPLTMILAPLDELLSGRPPAGGERNAFESMHRNASRLLRLINQLLDLAKIDAGEMKIHRVSTHLPDLLRGGLKAFEGAAQKKRVRLEVRAPENMATIAIDATWIDSAVTNLVANALRLTPSEGGVRVIVEEHGSHVTVAVSDDGPGIAPADQAKVFERFAQGDSSKRVVGGTGIGLALVREAARLHGGDVRLESTVGIGSTFTITLPRLEPGVVESAPLVATPVESARPSSGPSRRLIEDVPDLPASADRAGPTASAPLALVVEDNPELRQFIADALSSRYRVRAGGDGVQGLELASRLRPEVIVSDVAMPNMDGYEFCRRLRAQAETKDIPVLLVTARTEIASVLQGFDAGANDYLLKPFHTTELLARVDVHVRLRHLTAQLARRERLAALGSLAASVAHNVRNPLSSLISGLPAIRNRFGASMDASTNELMEIMLDCAERIERMTIDLLDLSRIDREVSGDFAPGFGLLTCTRMLASRIGPDVELVTDVDAKAMTSGRAGDINHVFMNVLDNALRAVGPKGRIEVRGESVDDAYVVTVADSGSGIDPDALERIFEPFWTTRAAGDGTGLGLSIARQIIEEHNGSIAAGRSALGGALFTLRIPLSKAARAVA